MEPEFSLRGLRGLSYGRFQDCEDLVLIPSEVRLQLLPFVGIIASLLVQFGPCDEAPFPDVPGRQVIYCWGEAAEAISEELIDHLASVGDDRQIPDVLTVF